MASAMILKQIEKESRDKSIFITPTLIRGAKLPSKGEEKVRSTGTHGIDITQIIGRILHYGMNMKEAL
ncbi:MAG: hypothetical protein ABIL86_09255, partial [candidate division WOR-3 bacterium]